MKKVLVVQRENAIVNRLNKTKVEKFPDLQMEREEKLKALRKKDQAAKLERVSNLFFLILDYSGANFAFRRKKRPGSLRSGKKRNGRRITRMMSCFRRKIQRMRITKTVGRISWMTLCRLDLGIHLHLNPF